MIKSFISFSSLAMLAGTLLACAAVEQNGSDKPEPSSAQSQLADMDSAPTGSLCGTTPPNSLVSFAPAAGQAGSTAISKDSPSIVAWADRVIDVDFGDAVAAQWKNSSLALGPAEGTSTDVVSLGEGGIITLGFSEPLADRDGYDFCIFENGFSDDFLELANVEVASTDRVFIRFGVYSGGAEPVESYGTIETALIDGFAGKYRQGYCTPFDLAALGDRPEVLAGTVDLSKIRYVRLHDVVGDGRALDCANRPIYDPFPTTGGAGFDLDGIGVFLAEQ